MTEYLPVYTLASDIVLRAPAFPDHPHANRVMAALRRSGEFRGTHEHYKWMIVQRYLLLHDKIPLADVLKAIRKGYSSPANAMADGAIAWRERAHVEAEPDETGALVVGGVRHE